MWCNCAYFPKDFEDHLIARWMLNTVPTVGYITNGTHECERFSNAFEYKPSLSKSLDFLRSHGLRLKIWMTLINNLTSTAPSGPVSKTWIIVVLVYIIEPSGWIYRFLPTMPLRWANCMIESLCMYCQSLILRRELHIWSYSMSFALPFVNCTLTSNSSTPDRTFAETRSVQIQWWQSVGYRNILFLKGHMCVPQVVCASRGV